MILSCFTSEWCLFSVTPKQIPVGVLLLAEEANVMVLSQHHTGPDANSLCQSICAELGHWIGIWQATLEAAGRVFLKAGVSPGVTERGQNRFLCSSASSTAVCEHECRCVHSLAGDGEVVGTPSSSMQSEKGSSCWVKRQHCALLSYIVLWNSEAVHAESDTPHGLTNFYSQTSKLMEAPWSYVVGKTTVLILIIN